MTNASTRSLGWALGISLALHLILLWQALDAVSSQPSGHATTPRPGRLSAMLHGEVPAVSAPAGAASGASATAMPQRTATPGAKRPVPLPAVPPAYASHAIGAEDAATTAPARATTGAAAAETNGLDANGMRQYRIELASTARRFRHHGTAALAAGRRGTAVVRVDVGAAGHPPTTALERSSDDAQLDAAALAMIDGAAQATAVPASLLGRTFSVIMPVEFFAAPE